MIAKLMLTGSNAKCSEVRKNVRYHISFSSSTVGEAIAIQVLERQEEFIERARTITETNRAIAKNWAHNDSHVEWVPPSAGINAFPRIKKDNGVDLAAIFRRLVKQYKTFVVDASMMEHDPFHFRLGFDPTRRSFPRG
ncbi:hypothetical protein [Ruegeria hyattellae]|uniref:hypothetical protein n=1 Tax=Ruegeria hyattellae TaxID=3233337 RepID=UPI00355C6DA3